LTLDISVVFEPFPFVSTRSFRPPPGLQIPPISEGFSPPRLGVSPSRNFFSLTNYASYEDALCLKLGAAVRREVPLLSPLPQLGVIGGLGDFLDFSIFEIFRFPLAAPFVHVAPPFYVHTIRRIKWVNVSTGHFLATGYRFGATGPEVLKSGFGLLNFRSILALTLGLAGANTP